MAIHGPTQVAEIRDGEIREYLLTLADFGLDTYPVRPSRAVSRGEPRHHRRHPGRTRQPGPQRRHRRQRGAAPGDGGRGPGLRAGRRPVLAVLA